MMKRLNLILLAGITSFLLLSTSGTMAQNQGGGQGRRGNFDPAQMRERMNTRIRERLELTNDDEWKAVEPLIQKVNDARMEVGRMAGNPFRGGRQGGGDNANGGNNDRRRNFFGGEPSPEVEALEKAIENKASDADIKAKLAKYRDAVKAKQAKLEQAQEDLRKVLTVRQEATAVTLGLLK